MNMPGADGNASPSQNNNNVLKSKKSMHCSLVRFQNRTDRAIDIVWLNYEGARVKYKTLRANEFVDVNTFIGHPWIFLDVETGERMVTELKDVYQTVYESNTKWSVQNQTRKIVNITNPIYTLKDSCIRFFKRLVPADKLSELELPDSLKEEMKEKFNNQFRCIFHSSSTMHG